MTERYDPPEEQIRRVLDTYSPRQIAIAYLRASRRARQAEIAFDVLDKLSSATVSAATGDTKGVSDALKDATRKLKRAKHHHS